MTTRSRTTEDGQPFLIREPHWPGCRCNHCSPGNADPKDEKYWRRQRGTTLLRRCICRTLYSLTAWRALKLVGKQQLVATEDEPARKLVMRNCVCGNTLVVELDEHGNEVAQVK